MFENEFLAELRKLHEEFGAVFTLNCFNTYTRDGSYDISDLPDRYAAELAANSDWLKFAFHAENDKTQYTETDTNGRVNGTADEIKASYKKFTDAVMKATGNNADSIDTVVRLGFFAGDADRIEALKECEYGITGLLTADDSRVSYYFDEALNSYIIENGDYYDTDKDLRLIRTQTRLESVNNTSEALESLGEYGGNVIEVFTHESEYTGDVPARLKAYIEWAYNNGCGFGYAEDVLGELIKTEARTAGDGRLDYRLRVSAGTAGTLAAAAYNADGTLYSVTAEPLDGNKLSVSVNIPQETPVRVKFMLWDSLGTMRALSKTVTDEYTAERSAVSLDRTVYPLVVGNKSKTDFSDWETRGSSFTLNAEVDSDKYDVSDIEWSVADEDIAYIVSEGSGSVTVRGKRTGFTEVNASLPDGDTAICRVSVIDNITRATVQTLELNTDSLILAPGGSAELIPIVYPKDVFGNGAMNSSVSWTTSDPDVASVENGRVTAAGVGTAVITAVSADVGRTAECTVTVSEDAKNAVFSAGSADVIDMAVGESISLGAESDGKRRSA